MSDAFDGKAVLPWMRSAEQIERRMAEIEDRMQKRHRILGDLRIALAVKVYRDQVDEGITLLDRCVKLIDESGSVAPNLLKDCLDYQQSIKDYNEGRKTGSERPLTAPVTEGSPTETYEGVLQRSLVGPRGILGNVGS